MSLLTLTNENFETEVLESEIPVLVDFYADWCGPCKMLSPTISELANEYEGKVKVLKLNIDEAEGVARKYNVMTIPTLILFKDGEVSGKIVGVKKKEAIIEELSL